MIDIPFESLIEHVKARNITADNFIKDICSEFIPATLAIWNEEMGCCLYLSKKDLIQIVGKNEIEITQLFSDINCQHAQMQAQKYTKIVLEQLLITKRAHRRLLSISIISNHLNNVGSTVPVLTKHRLKYYFLKDKWTPLETAHILCGKDPAPIINLKPEKSLSHEFNISSKNVFIETNTQIYRGYYDETEEEHIIDWHAQKIGHDISLMNFFRIIWSIYDILVTFEEEVPLAVLNNFFSKVKIDINTFQACDHLLMNVINEMKESRDSRYKNEYTHLNSLIKKYNDMVNAKKDLPQDIENESAIRRKERFQTMANEIKKDNPGWGKPSIAEEIKDREQKEGRTHKLATILRDFTLEKTRRKV